MKRVLSIIVDVSLLTDLEIAELQNDMEVQCEDAGGKCQAEKTEDNGFLFDAPILSSAIRAIAAAEEEEPCVNCGATKPHKNCEELHPIACDCQLCSSESFKH